jgi:hypothetical protein
MNGIIFLDQTARVLQIALNQAEPLARELSLFLT